VSLTATLYLAFLAGNAGRDLPGEDAARLGELFRLTAAVQERVWPGWSKAPSTLLLVAGDREYLVGGEPPPAGFEDAGGLPGVPARLLSRPRTFSADAMETIPAFGRSPVAVIGLARALRKSSPEWVLTAIHEHFHQLQFSHPGYARSARLLGLSGGDETGAWMVGYPFPYAAPAVARDFAALSRQLAVALEASSAAERHAFWKGLASVLASLPEKDRRYLQLQTWQEGVALYAEIRAAEVGARGDAPSREYAALPDYQPYGEVARRLRADLVAELRTPDLPGRQRSSFYALGAGMALLLDEEAASWKARYLDSAFALEDLGSGAR